MAWLKLPGPSLKQRYSKYILHSNDYINSSLRKSKPKECHLARGISEDECVAMNRPTCCPMVDGKPKNALPISCNPIVADGEKTAGGFLASRAA